MIKSTFFSVARASPASPSGAERVVKPAAANSSLRVLFSTGSSSMIRMVGMRLGRTTLARVGWFEKGAVGEVGH